MIHINTFQDKKDNLSMKICDSTTCNRNYAIAIPITNEYFLRLKLALLILGLKKTRVARLEDY